MLRQSLRIIEAISKWSGRLVAFFIYPGLAVLVYEVLARYAFNAPTIWAHGISIRLFATYYIICGAYVLYRRGHVKIDVMYNRLSLRGRAIADVITAWVFFLMCAFYIWDGIIYFLDSFRFLETDMTCFRAPIYPIKLMIPIGAVLLLLQGLAKFSCDLFTAVTGREYES